MVRPVHGELYYIRNVASGTRMDLNNGSSDGGTRIQGWQEGDTNNQRWTVRLAERADNIDWFWIECRASSTVLDLNNGDSGNGTPCSGYRISQWKNSNQMFRFIEDGPDRWRYVSSFRLCQTFLPCRSVQTC